MRDKLHKNRRELHRAFYRSVNCLLSLASTFKKCFTEIGCFSFQLKFRVCSELLDNLKIFQLLYFSNQFGDDLLFWGGKNPR